MQNSRARASLLNAISSASFQILQLLLRFILQNVFILTLGKSVAGANGLFTNLLTFLSFTDLGIGSAIIFALYKPIANEEHDIVESLMNLFQKIYIIIGLVITILGIGLSFFLDQFVKSGTQIPNMQILFILFLLNTSITYFFSYKQSLLIANQLGYIVFIYNSIFLIIQVVLQIFALKFFQSYIIYLIVQIGVTLLFNLLIVWRTNSIFGYLKQYPGKNVPEEILNDLKKNVIGTIASKIGVIFVFSTDNILISKFLGLSAVGLYSNYALIINGVNSVLNQGATSLVSNIGNLAVSEGNDEALKVFYKFQYVIFGLTFIVSFGLIALLQNFITLWLGNRFKLDDWTVLVIVLNFAINLIRLPILTFINAYGLYYPIRYKSLVEAFINFTVGLLLLMYTSLGITAVLIGTIVSNLTVNLWWEPLVLFKNGLEAKLLKYHIRTIIFMTFLILSLIIAQYISNKYGVDTISLLGFITKTLCVIAISVLLFLLVYLKSKDQKEIIEIVTGKLKNKKILK